MAAVHSRSRAVGRTDVLPTLGYALLSLIAREPLTGYGLASRLKHPIGPFWEAGHSQIYPELARLERRGLARSTSEAGPGPRPKKTYIITDHGFATLRRWVSEPAGRWGGRDDLLLKVYASWVAESVATVQLLRGAEAHHAAQLARYLAIQRHMRDSRAHRAPPSDPAFTEYATLRRGIGFERGRLAWCRWLIGKLEPRNG